MLLAIFVLTSHVLPDTTSDENAYSNRIGQVVPGADVLRERRVLPALEEAKIFLLTGHALPGTTSDEKFPTAGIGR